MRVVILGDLHCGARAGSSHFSDYFNRFFEEVLYPYCIKHKVKHILQLGDCFDNRTNLTYKSFYKSKDVWFKKMGDLGIKMTILLGNHDICYRHTLSINSPELLLGEYDHITVIKSPTQIEIGKTKFDIIPWMCDENEADIKKFIARKDKGSVLLGHLELAGFPQNSAEKQQSGFNDFDKKNAVLKKYGLSDVISSEKDYEDLKNRIRELKFLSKHPT